MRASALIVAVIVSLAGPARAASVPSPSEFLGLSVGADRTVADYRQILAYFKALDKASPRVEVEILGQTTLGEELFLAAISSEANLAKKKRLQEIARKIADPRGLTDAETEALVREGKVFLFVTCNIHSTEIGASQMAMEWAHALATAQDAETKRRLDEVVLLLLPSLNPDGQIMETEWYRKNLGTRYEGGRMPWLYHHYVGHDNNRDWFMLTQKETRAISRAVYHEWLPQVWLDEHQMGSTGPRIFMPPYAEPVDPDIHPLVWRDVNLIGANMAFRLEQAEQERGHLRLRLRRLLARRHEEHGLVEEHLGAPDRGGLGAVRDARSHRAGTSSRAGARASSSTAPRRTSRTPGPGGDVAAARHHGLRADRLRRHPRDLRRAARRLPQERARAGAGRDRHLRARRTPSASRPTQRDAAGAARLAALLAEHGVELRAAANGDVVRPARAALRPLRQRDA